MTAVNLNDTPLYEYEWAELPYTTALERHAQLKLTAADLDAADLRREAREQHTAALVIASVAARTAPRRAWPLRTWRRIARAVSVAWLQWQIDCDERWLKDAARDDVHGTLNLQMVRRELEELRVELAVVEAQS